MRTIVGVVVLVASGIAAAEPARPALPAPPSQEPRAYAAWLKAQPRRMQRRIEAHCRANPVEPEEVCGGIGPLHIPPPPVQVKLPAPRNANPYDAWWASLSGPQKQYVKRHCRDEDASFSSLCGATPLVAVFDGAPVAFTRDVPFALTPGAPRATDWPTAATPWLALDRDGDGAITSGAELLGSSTILPDGAAARDGFAALAALDANHDGVIDRDDPAFAKLLLWADRDVDGASAPAELAPAAGVIDSISLDVRIDLRCDARLDCERERATMRWHDAGGAVHTGEIVDVHLPYR